MFHTASSPDSRDVDFVVAFGGETDYREAGRVSMFEEGLKNNSKVVLEETIAVQQLFKSSLGMDVT